MADGAEHSLNTPDDVLIETQTQLEQAVGLMSGPIAVDTEFVRERTYYPQLCLLQVSDADTAVCVDCVAALDLEPMRTQLSRYGQYVPEQPSVPRRRGRYRRHPLDACSLLGNLRLSSSLSRWCLLLR